MSRTVPKPGRKKEEDDLCRKKCSLITANTKSMKPVLAMEFTQRVKISLACTKIVEYGAMLGHL